MGSHIGFGETSDSGPPSSDRRGSSRSSRSVRSRSSRGSRRRGSSRTRGVVVADLGVPGFGVNGVLGIGESGIGLLRHARRRSAHKTQKWRTCQISGVGADLFGVIGFTVGRRHCGPCRSGLRGRRGTTVVGGRTPVFTDTHDGGRHKRITELGVFQSG